MTNDVSGITKLRRKLFSKVAELALNNNLRAEVNNLAQTVIPEEGLGYRCCVHKERAIVKDRIKSALGLEPNGEVSDLSAAVDQALELDDLTGPTVNVLDIACDRCPLDKYRVSDACRNCVDHSCMNACPQDAIVTVQNRAYIDQEKCIECGLCKQSCPYNAILEMTRPCESACGVDAIEANNDRQANIDPKHCVSCGACIESCPFGAITYKSQILQVAKMLKKEKTIAVLAPSFVGQFGPQVTPNQIKQGLTKLGFDKVHEVALGADIVAIEETKELLAKVPKEQEFLTTSCCPSFFTLLKQEFPQLIEKSSSTVSPMVAIAKVLKKESSDAKIVFVGPCIAKKDEGLAYNEVDAVLTFEELGAMFVGAGINLVQLAGDNKFKEASDAGRTFGRAGGLVKAVTGSATELEPKIEFEAIQAEGLEECTKTLRLAQAGQYQNYFIEGMGCTGGCVGGPAALMNSKFTTKQVNDFGSKAQINEAIENKQAQEMIDKLGSEEFHRQK
ncbi:iron only hydrogenase large subunit [Halobacteroides halobius DSM 5150]|uniref:Iron only hydrogenase large subunit n=1 Tax=Halobacteroides halobius (strain ATCC 35273 / DSM 5150 / MD-1) TaxID=748449 RepID=L0K4W2_HALHC|nr:4Fe-4S dicluster domain-containing protein [Halobacteroides halobius]AGB40061.1 iron only hydrogenase large subunit [Halobacteroides halobius DSM 5150]